MKSGIHWNCSNEKRCFDLALATVLLPAEKTAGLIVRRLVARSCGIDMDPVVYDERLGIFGETFWPARYRTSGLEAGAQFGKWSDRMRNCGLDGAARLRNIRAGEMGFVGPQPVSQQEYELTMDSLSPHTRREWDAVLRLYVPGYISSYMIDAIATGGADKGDPGLRAELDIMDAACTSPRYDARLVGQCASLAIARHFHQIA